MTTENHDDRFVSPKLQHFQGCGPFYVFNDGFGFRHGGFLLSSNGLKRVRLLVISTGMGGGGVML